MLSNGLLRFEIADKLRTGEMNKADMVYILMVISSIENVETRKILLAKLLNKYSFLQKYIG